MNYQFLINGEEVLSGSLYLVIFISLILLGAIVVVGKIIRKKLKEHETLKYEFVSIIAHKFRTPLTQTKWLIETILGSETDSFKIESLKSIESSNKKLINLTGTLIELTDSQNKSISTYNFEKANICEMVNQVANSLKDYFHEKNLFMAFQCSSPEIYANVDKPRMEFVLHTLMENSINYSPTGRNVEILVSTDKNKAVISVVDYGMGIAAADLPKISSKFYRTSNAQTMDTEGFGVGLFLAQSIVKRHKGRIDVYSDGLGKGSTFTVTIPLL